MSQGGLRVNKQNRNKVIHVDIYKYLFAHTRTFYCTTEDTLDILCYFDTYFVELSTIWT